MKIKLIILFLITSFATYSQGFDWQYNARLPQDQPKIFLGALVEYGVDFHTGDFNMNELGITCCSFSDGNGNNFALGAALEYWLENGFSSIISVKYNLVNAEFSSIETLPTVYGEFQREFLFNTNIHYLNLGVGGRYKFISTGFSASFQLDVNTLLSSDNEYSDRKISPPQHPYQGGTFSNRKINDLNNFNLFPKFGLAYDLNLGLGTYSTIYAESSLPLFNMVNDADWRLFRFSLGIRVLRAID